MQLGANVYRLTGSSIGCGSRSMVERGASRAHLLFVGKQQKGTARPWRRGPGPDNHAPKRVYPGAELKSRHRATTDKPNHPTLGGKLLKIGAVIGCG